MKTEKQIEECLDDVTDEYLVDMFNDSDMSLSVARALVCMAINDGVDISAVISSAIEWIRDKQWEKAEQIADRKQIASVINRDFVRMFEAGHKPSDFAEAA